jgi:hypothetical protein
MTPKNRVENQEFEDKIRKKNQWIIKYPKSVSANLHSIESCSLLKESYSLAVILLK